MYEGRQINHEFDRFRAKISLNRSILALNGCILHEIGQNGVIFHDAHPWISNWIWGVYE